METFDQACSATYKSGRVAMEEVAHVGHEPHDFKLALASGGQRSTSSCRSECGPPGRQTPPRLDALSS